MTLLGFLSCMINTVLVVAMGIAIIESKQYAHLALLLVVLPALAGQWYLSFRKRK